MLLSNGWDKSEFDPIFESGGVTLQSGSPDKKKIFVKRAVLLLTVLIYLVYSSLRFWGLVKGKISSGEIGKSKSEEETEAWNKASPEKKERMVEMVNRVAETAEREWIKEETKDQTKIAMKLPAFWNASVEEA